MCLKCKLTNSIVSEICKNCQLPRNTQKLSKRVFGQKLDYLLVIDFECTCQEGEELNLMEIIEFPIVVVDVKKQIITSSYHTYVRPVINPKLTPFCTNLTGITQAQVDQANPLKMVLEAVDYFLQPYLASGRCAVVNDCGSDMKRFLYQESKYKNIKLKPYFDSFINLKKVFPDEELHHLKKLRDINSMLDCFGLTFKGRKHSGFDDSINIAKVSIELIKREYIFSSLLLESTYPLEIQFNKQIYDYLVVINLSFDKKTEVFQEFSAVILHLNNNKVFWNNLTHHIFASGKSNSERLLECFKVFENLGKLPPLRSSKYIFGSLTARPFNYLFKQCKECEVPVPTYLRNFFIMRD